MLQHPQLEALLADPHSCSPGKVYLSQLEYHILSDHSPSFLSYTPFFPFFVTAQCNIITVSISIFILDYKLLEFRVTSYSSLSPQSPTQSRHLLDVCQTGYLLIKTDYPFQALEIWQLNTTDHLLHSTALGFGTYLSTLC